MNLDAGEERSKCEEACHALMSLGARTGRAPLRPSPQPQPSQPSQPSPSPLARLAATGPVDPIRRGWFSYSFCAPGQQPRTPCADDGTLFRFAPATAPRHTHVAGPGDAAVAATATTATTAKQNACRRRRPRRRGAKPYPIVRLRLSRPPSAQ